MADDFYENAKSEGYSDQEIRSFLFKKDPNFSKFYKKARDEGYSEQEILSFSPKKPTREEYFKPEEKEPFQTGQIAEDLFHDVGAAGLRGIEAVAFPFEAPAKATKALYRTPGAISQVTRQNAAGLMENLQESNVGKPFEKWSEQDKENYDYYKRVLGSPDEDLQDLAAIPDISIEGAAKEILGFDQSPRTTFGSFLGLLADLYGYSIGNVKAVAGMAPMAAAAVTADETFGVPEWASMPIMAGVYQAGKSTWRLAKKGAEWMSKRFFLLDPKQIKPDMNIKSVQAAMRGEAEKQFNEGILSAKEYEGLQPFFETAEKYGIVIDPASLSKSKRFQKIQKYLSRTDATEEQKAAFLQKATDSWAKSYLRATENVSKNAVFEDENSLLEKLSSDVTKKKHASLKKKYGALYEKSEQGLKDAKPISREATEKIQESLDDVITKTSGSLFETAPEKETKGIAKAAKEKLKISPEEVGREELVGISLPTGEETAGIIREQATEAFEKAPGQRTKMKLEAAKKTASNVKDQAQKKASDTVKRIFGPDADVIDGKIVFRRPLSPGQLVKSIRSLNNTLEWENPNVINLLTPVRQTLIDVLQSEYGKSHSKALFDLKIANNTFAKTQKLFGEDSLWKKWGIKRTDVPLPEELDKTLNSVSRFQQFEKDFGRTKEGKDLIDNLKLIKINKKLEPIFVKEYTPGSIASGLMKVERDPMFKYLTPQETKDNLAKLAQLDKRVQQRSSNFYRNTDNLALSADYVADAFSFLNPKMWAIKFADKLRKDQISEAYAYVMMNPEITSKMARLGEETVKLAEKGYIKKSTLDKARAEIANEWENVIDEVKTVIESLPATTISH